MSNTQAVNDFIAITGSDSSTANRYLSSVGWSLERAISNYFDAPQDHTPITAPVSACRPYPFPPPPLVHPPPSPPLVPPILPPQDDNDNDDGDFPVVSQLKSGSVILPLHGLSVILSVNQYVAEVQVLQRFVNMEANPIEAIFTFQQEDVSIYEFYAEIAGRKITSVCKEKQAAFNTYDDAIAGGHGGYLLDKESEDQFKLNVGNLPPYAECVISIKYATLLSTSGDALKITVPITKVAIMLRGGEVMNWDTKTLSPIPNGLSLRANIQMASPIFGIESETHEIKYEINGNTATLSLAGTPTSQPAREFTCLIGIQDPHKSGSSVVEVVNGQNKTGTPSSAVMLAFYPTIENLADDNILMEYVFLVDRSGSMSGSRISQLVNALQLLLRSIPVGSLFNIVGFGSTFERLFPSSVVYDDSSFETATNHAAGMKANLIGTNILPPLYDILSKAPHAKFPRQLFVLTDGEVDNTEEVINMVKKNIGSTRIFTIGIGAEASKRLVKGLAKAGKGQADFVNSGTRMEPTVLAQLKRAMQPHLSVEVDWGTIAKNVKQAPAIIPPVFPCNPVVVFGIVNGNIPQNSNNNIVILKLSSPDGDSRQVPVSLSPPSTSPSPASTSMVGVLAATAIISDIEKRLEDKLISETEAKNQIIPLATKYSLVTKYTSLVAQEIREDPITQATMEVRQIGELIPPQVQMLKEKEESKYSFALGGFAAPGQQSYVRHRGERVGLLGGGGGGIMGGGGSGGDGWGGGGGRREGRKDFKKTISADDARGRRQDAAPSIRKSVREESLEKRKKEKDSAAQGFAARPAAPMAQSQSHGVADLLSGALFSARRTSAASMDSSDDEEEWEDSGDYESYAAPPRGNTSFSTFSSPSSSLSFSSHPPPSAAPLPSKPDPTKRPLDLFVIMQQASGNWPLSQAFMTTIGKTKSQIESVFGSVDGWLANVVATALAIVFMEIKFAENVDEWSMLKDKAIRWMTKELQNKKHTDNVEHFIQRARQVLQ